jgi:hypothetical protein
MALVALGTRKDAERSLREAIDDALRRLVGQEVSFERAAALLELDATEVRRLTRSAAEQNGHLLKSSARLAAPRDSDSRNSATRRGDRCPHVRN